MEPPDSRHCLNIAWPETHPRLSKITRPQAHWSGDGRGPGRPATPPISYADRLERLRWQAHGAVVRTAHCRQCQKTDWPRATVPTVSVPLSREGSLVQRPCRWREWGNTVALLCLTFPKVPPFLSVFPLCRSDSMCVQLHTAHFCRRPDATVEM